MNESANTPIQLVVGLGNPGNKYDHTRHNAGQEWLQQLADNLGIKLVPEKRFFGLYGQGMVSGQKIHLLIPTQFMNLSGQSVQALCSFYKVPTTSMLVAHDELDLPPGVARFKKAGGHGGHNGLRDIISRLGGKNDFNRLRLGIGHPGNANLVSAYVLRVAPKQEQELLQDAITKALYCLDDAIQGDWQKAMHRLHS